MITGILAKHGVERMGWASERAGDTLMFELAGYNFRFNIAKPTLDEVKQCPDCECRAQAIPWRGGLVWRCPWTMAATWARRPIIGGLVACGRPYSRTAPA